MKVRPIIRATLGALFAIGVGVAGAQVQTSPTDGRTGGTGPMSATPQTDRAMSDNAGTATPSRRDSAMRRDRSPGSATNPTDGRNSGTGPMGNNPRTDQVGDPRSDLGSRSAISGSDSGASSARVRQVQHALEANGHDVGGVDGVMGPKTQAALRDYQQSQGLPSTGRLDAATLSALGVSNDGTSAARNSGMSNRDTTSGAGTTSSSAGTSTTGTTRPSGGALPSSGAASSGGTASPRSGG